MDASSVLVGFVAGFFFWAFVFLAAGLILAGRGRRPLARPPAPSPPPPGDGGGGDPRRQRTMWGSGP
jgi:hypothetical protein